MKQFAICLGVVVILLLNVMKLELLCWIDHVWSSKECMCVVPVVVCLPIPMEGMGRLQFSDLFTELTVPPQADGVVGTF